MWTFDKPANGDSKIICPDCKNAFALKTWVDTEVYCEDCGSHAAIQCPGCGHAFDHVWSPVFKVEE